jgi:hypothetical protein
MDVIQAPKLEPRIMEYELSDLSGASPRVAACRESGQLISNVVVAERLENRLMPLALRCCSMALRRSS